MSILAVIPARLQSTRFPEKPLVPLLGVPMVRHTALRVLNSGRADHVIVSTDDAEIAALVADLPLEVTIDRSAYRAGSDRVAAAASRGSWGAVVNVQVDEVLVQGSVIDAALAALGDHEIGTVAAPLRPDESEDPNVVKVASSPAVAGRALDFSRHVPEGWRGARVAAHVGIYAFRPNALQRFARLPSAIREERTALEQLRALDRGWTIGLGQVAQPLVAVNTPDDTLRAERALESEQEHRGERRARASAAKGP